jgi:hypothetical protein
VSARDNNKTIVTIPPLVCVERYFEGLFAWLEISLLPVEIKVTRYYCQYYIPKVVEAL